MKIKLVFKLVVQCCLPVMTLIMTNITFAQSSEPKLPITIALIGDSTVAESSGWGVPFRQRFTNDVKVLNFAKGGASSKNWYDGNRMPAVLASKPDYVLIQFGHNDQPGKGPTRETDPATSYRENLGRYVAEVQSIGAIPVIVSSVTRRRFDADDKIRTTLTPWADAAKSAASELNVPFIDLHRLSIQLHNSIGPEASMKFNFKEGDLTHFNRMGGAVIADLVIKELQSAVPKLTSYVKEKPSLQTVP
ncbi:rhamnogalacturonan acetylesterase [Rubripirellula reticaptiva]|nr:rhamnogalacturonan acetylesterase [Rubripirellula reticaptiva]